jgi:hypothetical protein
VPLTGRGALDPAKAMIGFAAAMLPAIVEIAEAAPTR